MSPESKPAIENARKYALESRLAQLIEQIKSLETSKGNINDLILDLKRQRNELEGKLNRIVRTHAETYHTLTREASELMGSADPKGRMIAAIGHYVLRGNIGRGFSEEIIETVEDFPKNPNYSRVSVGKGSNNARIFFLDDGRMGLIARGKGYHYGLISTDEKDVTEAFVLRNQEMKIVPERALGNRIPNLINRASRADEIRYSQSRGNSVSIPNPLQADW